MPLVINTNVSSLNSQRQLVRSGNDMETAMERLSSGKRINSASDDAAGLAIANRMTSQIRGLNQAVRNANDGISMIQTAEGALDESTNILQRMRELSIQAANGIYTDADRSTLDAEVQQLKAELQRIADSTTFNGQKLLDGSLGTVELQVGNQANQTIDLSIPSFSPASLGGGGGDVVGEAVSGIAAVQVFNTDGDLVINGTDISDLSGITTVNDFLDIANADLDGTNVSVSTLVTVEAASEGNGILRGTDTLTIAVIDGDQNTSTYVISDTSNLNELVTKINEDTSVTASLNEQGRLVLSQEGVESIQIADATTAVATGIADATYQFSVTLTESGSDKNGITISADASITATELAAFGMNENDTEGNLVGFTVDGSDGAADLTNADLINDGDLIINGIEIDGVTFSSAAATAQDVVNQINEKSSDTNVVAFVTGTNQVGLRAIEGEITIEYGESADAATVLDITGLVERNASEGSSSVQTISIKTANGAQAAISVIDRALEEVNAIRSDMGAANNRLEFTMNNMMNVSEKTSAARSRIMDADFAAETAELSRSQVLQQASTAMLAQANARTQQVLQLLQG